MDPIISKQDQVQVQQVYGAHQGRSYLFRHILEYFAHPVCFLHLAESGKAQGLARGLPQPPQDFIRIHIQFQAAAVAANTFFPPVVNAHMTNLRRQLPGVHIQCPVFYNAAAHAPCYA